MKAGQKDYIGYKVVENWPIKGADAGSLPRGFGQVAGVDEDHHEHVVIFHRAYRSWDGRYLLIKLYLSATSVRDRRRKTKFDIERFFFILKLFQKSSIQMRQKGTEATFKR